MAIFLDDSSKVIVQGMTGSEGMKHTQRMLASGTQVVGGVNPRKAGTEVGFEGGVTVPVFGTVAEAMEATGANVSVVFVPPKFAKDAVIEAVDATMPLLVVITEGIAVRDTIADQKRLEKQLEQAQASAAEWERKAMTAINADRDDLAREALGRKQEADEQCAQYQSNLELQRANAEELKGALRQLAAKVEEAQRKKNVLIARQKRVEATNQMSTTATATSTRSWRSPASRASGPR
mgnify:CR=1 FL=1